MRLTAIAWKATGVKYIIFCRIVHGDVAPCESQFVTQFKHQIRIEFLITMV
jgi:hypothetical protein